MPEVYAELYIPKPPQEVYRAARDLAGLKPYLKDVETLEVLEDTGSTSRTRFVAVAMGKKVQWIEEERWFDSELRNEFESTEGDFDLYQGTWTFLPEGEGTKAALRLEYELNIPIFGGLLQKLVKKLMQENVEGLLAGLKERCLAT
ncbi:Polyketide cyclase / dehydrase and lipid transport [Meiothermus luteus]|jgi:ribosome-associated toxin RatA of RatAB toxin-antitoxin module|uniref:Polyketide cyclase / dehydrase and lipid transport n=1 Tax=Meiothermus luteus TaxID=2026184 RepID=A0A399ESA9_9DEIN|nr:SRPBCC family protein [Meiothermus luteus]RIH87494.1 Polyketide cyclase / dehydrase and lipid transport [Meiothermus luteus]RMH58714.1 MAG: SRPBCC family protein [Deinococcota bacterium]